MVCSGSNKIISIGGGAFENPDTRSTLLKFGIVFYLKSDIDVLYNRTSKENIRPLLQTENPAEALKNLLIKRQANYEKAHYIIDTGKMSEEDIINTILGSVNEE